MQNGAPGGQSLSKVHGAPSLSAPPLVLPSPVDEFAVDVEAEVEVVVDIDEVAVDVVSTPVGVVLGSPLVVTLPVVGSPTVVADDVVADDVAPVVELVPLEPPVPPGFVGPPPVNPPNPDGLSVSA